MLPRCRIRVPVCLLIALVNLGCSDLVEHPQDVNASSPAEPVLSFDPVESPDGVAPITHVRVGNLATQNQRLLHLVQGTVSASTMRDLASNQLSSALQKRVVNTMSWRIDDTTELLVPMEPLTFGQQYSVVVPQQKWFGSFVVMAQDELPWVQRVWPDNDIVGRLFVWCERFPDQGIVTPQPQPWQLFPQMAGIVRWGAVQGVGASCVSWERVDNTDEIAVPEGANHGAVPAASPVLLPLADGRWARVVPSIMWVQPAQAAPAAPPQQSSQLPHDQVPAEFVSRCDPPLLANGPVCAHVMDDRVKLCATHPWLIAAQITGHVQVDRVGIDHDFFVRPLPPSSVIDAILYGVTPCGTTTTSKAKWHTSSPIARIVINEVMANPVGPEPQQEWVELYNDGSTSAQLTGWQLQDASGAITLPSARIMPGQFALIVAHDYDPHCWLDTPAPPSVQLIRVPQVATGGISNSGEPLRLVDATLREVSRIPAIASKRAGHSIARVTPQAPDDAPESFRLHPNGGTPGTHNTTP